VLPYSHTLVFLVCGLLITWATVRVLATSKYSAPRWKLKSTWKVLELPWLGLACLSLLFAQQNLIVNELAKTTSAYQSKFARDKLEFEDITLQYAAQRPKSLTNVAGVVNCLHGDLQQAEVGGFIHFKAARFLSSEVDSVMEVKNFCIWNVIVYNMLRWSEARLLSAEVFSADSILEPFLSGPMSKNSRKFSNEFGLMKSAISYHHQRHYGLLDEYSHPCVSMSDAPTSRIYGFSSNVDEHVVWGAACEAVYSALAYAHLKSSARDMFLIKSDYTWAWPLLLVGGLLFRVGRTFGEYYLDREVEAKAQAAKLAV
jgi:hypothetical protein